MMSARIKLRTLGSLTAAIVFVTACLEVHAQDSTKSGAEACFARLKKLTGDWFQKDSSGKERLVLQYRVTSAGSALEETIMPGSPEEMTSIYHLDNGKLVMTHYCSLHNQPKLKALDSSTPSKIVLECNGPGGNMKSENDMHIHKAVFNLTADDHFTSNWSANKDGKPMGHEVTFDVYRQNKK